MVNQEFKIKQVQNPKRRVVLVDHISLWYFGDETGTIQYKLLSIDEVRKLLNDDSTEIYSCMQHDNVRRVYEAIFNIKLPSIGPYSRCGITEDDLNNCLWFLMPSLSGTEALGYEGDIKFAMSLSSFTFVLAARYPPNCK